MSSRAPSKKRLHVGIFLPAPPGARWRGEGIAHTLEFILGGFKERGRLGTDIRLTFFTTPWLEPDLRASLTETLGSLDGIDVVMLRSRKRDLARRLNAIFSLGGLIRRRKPTRRLRLSDLPEKPSASFLRKYYKHGLFFAISQSEGRAVALERARRVETEGLDSIGGSTWSSASASAEAAIAANDTTSGMRMFNMLLGIARAIPIVRRLTIRISDSMRANVERDELVYQAKDAAALKDEHGIDVWWVPQPNIDAPEYLQGPVLANFWDFVIGEYGYYWDYGSLNHIYNRVKLTLLAADAVVTQSFHNKDLKLCLGFDVPEDRVNVCYLSGPTHYKEAVPTFAASGKKTAESLQEAAEIIRTYLYRRIATNVETRAEGFHRHGNEVEKLFAFPFETAKFAMVSTQNRPYKNVPFLVDAFLKLVNERELDAYLIMTTEYSLSDPNDKIAQVIHKRHGIGRVFCLSRVPNKVHAALYHCATATLHPSFTEGGVGAFSFMEGMIMGTPGLVARGDYTLEGRRLHPDYDRLLLDPVDTDVAMDQIEYAMTHPEALYKTLLPVYEAHRTWTWADVSEAYLSVLRSLAGDARAASDTPTDFLTTKRAYHSLRPLDGRASPLGQAAE